MVTRRQLFQGALALGASLVLPPTLEENAKEARRFWALGAMPRSFSPDLEWVMDLDQVTAIVRNPRTITGTILVSHINLDAIAAMVEGDAYILGRRTYGH